MKLLSNCNCALASLALLAPLTCLPFASAAGDWAPSGAMNEPRSSNTATLLPDGKVLVTGGRNLAGSLNTAELRDPATGAWTSTGVMKSAREGHTATLLPNGKVLVVAGYDAELFDPVAKTWTLTGSPEEGYYSGHTATLLLNGKVLVVDGNDDNAAELYDPATGTWTNTSKEHYSEGQTATLLPNGKVLVVGSSDGRTDLYDPTTNKWSIVYDNVTDKWTGGSVMNIQRKHHTATLLGNGKVLVAGGYGGIDYDELSSAEIYDIATGKWTLAGDMGVTRRGHTATLLPNGKVLVAGGYYYDDSTDKNNYVSSTELFDPATGSWTPNGDMGAQRVNHSAVMLPNGKVLITGGHNSLMYLSSTELYTIPTPPSITDQPDSRTIKKGKRAILSVRATGTGLTYQWYVGKRGDTSKPIKNATSRTYRTIGLKATTKYWVMVKGSVGSVASKTAIVKVK